MKKLPGRPHMTRASESCPRLRRNLSSVMTTGKIPGGMTDLSAQKTATKRLLCCRDAVNLLMFLSLQVALKYSAGNLELKSTKHRTKFHFKPQKLVQLFVNLKMKSTTSRESQTKAFVDTETRFPWRKGTEMNLLLA